MALFVKKVIFAPWQPCFYRIIPPWNKSFFSDNRDKKDYNDDN